MTGKQRIGRPVKTRARCSVPRKGEHARAAPERGNRKTSRKRTKTKKDTSGSTLLRGYTCRVGHASRRDDLGRGVDRLILKTLHPLFLGRDVQARHELGVLRCDTGWAVIGPALEGLANHGSASNQERRGERGSRRRRGRQRSLSLSLSLSLASLVLSLSLLLRNTSIPTVAFPPPPFPSTRLPSRIPHHTRRRHLT